MGKTTVVKKKDKYVVVNRLIHPEAINERELHPIAGGLLVSLIPVTTEVIKKDTFIKGSITGMLSLKAYFSGIVNKKMFLDIILQLTAVVKECEKNLMNVSNLMLDWDYIFVDPVTKKVKCIFWPIVNNQNEAALPAFFKDIPFRLVFTKHEDREYVSVYLRYFRNHSPFSIHSFEKLLFGLIGKEAEAKPYEPSGSIGVGESHRLSNHPEKSKSVSIAYNPFGIEPAVFEKLSSCPKCGKTPAEGSKFCTACGTPLSAETPAGAQGKSTPAEPVKTIYEPPALKITPDATEAPEIKATQNFSETTVLGAESLDDGGTTVLGADIHEEPAFPYLIRGKTEEKIIVNKPSFRIGKERQYCDYFVSDNNAVSRSHADIITRDHRYYIIDHNSTNKTYVDGRIIPAQKEIEIFSGTKLKLGNENFVFYL
jgi:hypothetical protein